MFKEDGLVISQGSLYDAGAYIASDTHKQNIVYSSVRASVALRSIISIVNQTLDYKAATDA